MNEQELQMLVEELSITYFSQAFLHKATFNSRLKTTGGRYHLSSHNLDFNPRILEIYGRDELIGVIKHELCHYHLHLQGSGYRHQDQAFKALLVKTGGSRYVADLRTKDEMGTYCHYKCQSCNQAFSRKRKINTSKYRCGKCHGKLKQIEK